MLVLIRYGRRSSCQKKSEEIILSHDGRICDWLPTIKFHTDIRTSEEIISRALILNALINIAFKAPTQIIKEWIEKNKLLSYLTLKEQALINKKNEELTDTELTDLSWSLESLWALMWVGSLIDSLPFDEHVGDNLSSLSPDLQKGDDTSKYAQKMKIRNPEEIYEKLDLYYRLHWFTRDSQLNNLPSGNISNDIIFERRKALEWVYHKNYNWDNVPLDT